MRRTAPTVALLAAATIALTGCGSSTSEPTPTTTASASPLTEEVVFLEYEVFWEPEDESDTMPVTGSYTISGVVPGISEFDALIPSIHEGLPRNEVHEVASPGESNMRLYSLEDVPGRLGCTISDAETGDELASELSEASTPDVTCSVTIP